jgi:hypothetical protein
MDSDGNDSRQECDVQHSEREARLGRPPAPEAERDRRRDRDEDRDRAELGVPDSRHGAVRCRPACACGERDGGDGDVAANRPPDRRKLTEETRQRCDGSAVREALDRLPQSAGGSSSRRMKAGGRPQLRGEILGWSQLCRD